VSDNSKATKQFGVVTTSPSITVDYRWI